ncbi:hypothetical protein QRZ27_00750 [Escherichia coli]|uniref:hypothetical protein n=1 Tax=Escherichia coli TaxID=562 RepID=UPI001B08534F|nr:hypothetical protein [Escherichia coli]MCX2092353.1 hypothetical protein [Escherichia coli]MDL4377235.1 hypothetical protein [Escherichia coli]HBA7447911.1 hypothetical protein [Escherichia coli]HBA7462137.1 hypothetical protein [Escherichia coli]HBA7590680.1 hypothetical protein [Escherichia coli]
MKDGSNETLMLEWINAAGLIRQCSVQDVHPIMLHAKGLRQAKTEMYRQRYGLA